MVIILFAAMVANVWPTALGAAILSLIITIAAVMIRLIKRASLGSEFRDIEKILDKFGSSKDIEFDINEGEEKDMKSFSPKQLSEFIKIKHQHKKQWEDKKLALYKLVIESKTAPDTITENLLDVCHKGLYIKIPKNWSFEKRENSVCPSIITSNNGIDSSIKVSIDTRYPNIEDSVEHSITEIGEYRSKFIRSTLKTETVNGCSICSVGYAYKFEKLNHYGLVIGYQIAPDLVAILQITNTKDWSFLCTELITTIIESVKYEPVLE